jgi:hypothetical protein
LAAGDSISRLVSQIGVCWTVEAHQAGFKANRCGSIALHRLVIRRGYKKTIIALAHKLIRTIYTVLQRHKPYRDSTFDYEAASVAKNAPRWIRALKKYGYWPQAAAAT